MTNLTTLQSKFINEYIIDLNPVNAAIRAGYTADYAKKNAPGFLLNVNIKKNIQEKIHQNAQNLLFSKAFFASMLLKILNYSSVIEEIIDKNGMTTGDFKMKDVGSALKSLDGLSKLCSENIAPFNSKSSIEVDNLDINLI